MWRSVGKCVGVWEGEERCGDVGKCWERREKVCWGVGEIWGKY